VEDGLGAAVLLCIKERVGPGPVLQGQPVGDHLAHREATFGARPLDYRSESPLEVLRELTEGRGADAVLEVVGSPGATRTAVDLVRPGGVVASVGVHTEEHLAFAPAEAYDRNLTYRTGRCPARHYMERLLPLLAEGRFPVGKVISHRLPLEAGPGAYALFDAKQDGCTKAVLQP
jgi:threonine dehydrogenase-like Zn-dependent dehydrogenase